MMSEHQDFMKRKAKTELDIKDLADEVEGDKGAKVRRTLDCYTVRDWLVYRADSRFAPSQWETALLCNDVSHWLGAYIESALGV